tara:strand:- start:1360 stop:1491 length:132 start_codon:yes stop_codon:yes gene_type:complete
MILVWLILILVILALFVGGTWEQILGWLALLVGWSISEAGKMF